MTPPATPPSGLPAGFRADFLARNLAALGERDGGLVRRLTWPVSEAHVRIEPGGAALLNWRRAWRRLDLEGEAQGGRIVQRASIPGTGGVLLGSGLGELVESALAESGDAPWIAWERDPWLVRLMLSRVDFSDELSSGRLTLALASDLVPLARSLAGGGLAAMELRAHPLLGSIYASELEALLSGAAGQVALVAEGELFVDQIKRALGRRNLIPIPVDLERLSLEELDHTVRTLRPALLFSINYTHGLAEFCEQRSLPWVCWEVDPSTDELQPLKTPTRRGHVFTYARRHVSEFKAAGFSSVHAMPLAADVLDRKPWEEHGPERENYRAQVAFVGASMVQRGRELFEDLVRRADRAGIAGARERCEQLLARQRGPSSAFHLGAWLDREWPELEAALASTSGPSARTALGEVAAAEKRLGLVAGLSDFDTQVWGDEGWKLVETHGIRWRGGARHQTDLPRIYSSAEVNLDIGRLYQSDIITMRVFDVLACGGLCLTEANEEVSELFEIGAELDVYEGAEDLQRRIRWWLERPLERARVAARGREAVLERHTIDRRLGVMLGYAFSSESCAA